MANYKGIKGFKIRSVSSDPTANLGQVWYNTTSTTIKYDGVGSGAWSTSTSAPAARQRSMGFGTTTAALYTAGQLASGIPDGTSQVSSFAWNGASWTDTTHDIGTARRGGVGFGTQTDGMICGGIGPPPSTSFVEIYNGSSWTETTEMTTPRSGFCGGGTTTA